MDVDEGFVHLIARDSPLYFPGAEKLPAADRVAFGTYIGPLAYQNALSCSGLLRFNGQDASSYYRRICDHPTALKVKLADIADNSSEARLELLDPLTAARLRRKYVRALEALGNMEHGAG
ncbi:hypothetical protein [Xanthomonas citri]|uniref:hypothetical protein n=1 Tax=Xanthomonas citri TaxID=346 RepID=UPI002FCB01EB